VISRLEGSGVVECSGNTVALAGDWLDALNRKREIAGEIDALRRDMARFSREREVYGRRGEIGAELSKLPERPPDGEIRELERVEVSEANPELVEALAAYLDRRPQHHPDRHPPEDRRMQRSWLAVALWGDELVESKPTPEAVEVALASAAFRLAKLAA